MPSGEDGTNPEAVVDTNGDGVISQEEMSKGHALIDADGDGQIDAGELASAPWFRGGKIVSTTGYKAVSRAERVKRSSAPPWCARSVLGPLASSLHALYAPYPSPVL